MTWPTKKLGEALRKLIPILLLGLIFSFVFAFGFSIFNQIFIDQNLDYTNSAIGAFMGAFFAFLFIRLAQVFDAIYKRKKNNHNELIYLERLFNLYLVATNDNRFLSIKLADTLRQGELELSLLNTYEVRIESLMKLTDINYLNKILGFVVDLRKINHDINITNNWNTELRSALIQKNIDFTKYKEQAAVLAKNIDVLSKYFLSFQDKIIDLLCENEILIDKSKTLLSRLIGEQKIKISKEEIEKKKKEFLKQLEKSKKESSEEIKKITKGTIFEGVESEQNH